MMRKIHGYMPEMSPLLQPYCGLPITTYFSAVKLCWLLENSEKVQEAIRDGRCLFGTVDSWLLWVNSLSSSYLYLLIHDSSHAQICELLKVFISPYKSVCLVKDYFTRVAKDMLKSYLTLQCIYKVS